MPERETSAPPRRAPPEPLRSKFAGSLLGGMLGDIVGAVVEGESPRYIRKTFRSVGDILTTKHVEELFGGEWLVGRFTDDTQMSLCVAEWLLEEATPEPRNLLARFSEAYRPGRRYGPGVARILEAFPLHADEWRALATMMFPGGSYGNGSAMRVGPIGCYYYEDVDSLIEAARLSSLTTHSHPLGVQGATLQAAAVAAAVRATPPLSAERFVASLDEVLSRLQRTGQDVSAYRRAVRTISRGLAAGLEPSALAQSVGTGVTALEAVPMAICCFLAHPESFERVIEEAVFLGGDTDTIAAMAGAIAGAFLGSSAIPPRWLERVQEEHYTPERVERLAEALLEKALRKV
ncbi:MAG: ADP-ribosylglycohydrolase family protein [Armatimonadetes bacterium]|nr:ADP-ribosylglycohydrolase family protein [Armatimonadota bacterium]